MKHGLVAADHFAFGRVYANAKSAYKPAAPNLVMLGPALSYFAVWYILGVIGFWPFGFEPKGRTFEEIDNRHATPAPADAAEGRAAAG